MAKKEGLLGLTRAQGYVLADATHWLAYLREERLRKQAEVLERLAELYRVRTASP